MSQIQTIYLNFNLAYPLIFGSCFIGFCFGLINWIKVRFIKKKIANIDTTQKPPDTSNCLHKKTPIILMNKTSLYIQEVLNYNCWEQKHFYFWNAYIYLYSY